jgi:hypothetical protein
MKLEEAMFNARLHLEKGTLLSDEAVREVCKALIEVVTARAVPVRVRVSVHERAGE